jgi:hypothetical protein
MQLTRMRASEPEGVEDEIITFMVRDRVYHLRN